jgi:hypothetical protein
MVMVLPFALILKLFNVNFSHPELIFTCFISLLKFLKLVILLLLDKIDDFLLFFLLLEELLPHPVGVLLLLDDASLFSF